MAAEAREQQQEQQRQEAWHQPSQPTSLQIGDQTSVPEFSPQAPPHPQQAVPTTPAPSGRNHASNHVSMSWGSALNNAAPWTPPSSARSLEAAIPASLASYSGSPAAPLPKEEAGQAQPQRADPYATFPPFTSRREDMSTHGTTSSAPSMTSAPAASTWSHPNSSTDSAGQVLPSSEGLDWKLDSSAAAGANWEAGAMAMAAASPAHQGWSAGESNPLSSGSPLPSSPHAHISPSPDSRAPAAATAAPPGDTSAAAAAPAAAVPAAASPAAKKAATARKQLRERRVPESPLGRALGFAGLGAGLVMGSLSDSLGRAWGGRGAQQVEGAQVRGILSCRWCTCAYIH